MWMICKYKKKKLQQFMKNLREKTGSDIIFYYPKILIEGNSMKRKQKKIIPLLDNYIFCKNTNYNNSKLINYLQFTKNLEYILSGYIESQNEIMNFIKKCKKAENEMGFISQKFFTYNLFSSYRFYDGPFNKKLFKIVEITNNKISILINNLQIKISKNKYLFY